MSTPRSFKLDASIEKSLEDSDDLFVKLTSKSLEEFAGIYATSARKRPASYYLSDEKFTSLFGEMKSVESRNRLTISYMIRNIETFRVASVFRAGELISTAVTCINAGDIISASILLRSLLELTVRNQEAANVIYANLKAIEWDRFDKDIFGFRDIVDGKNVEESLLHYVDKLVFGSRLEMFVGEDKYLEHKNILTILEKVDKNCRKKLGYGFFDKYQFLCEMAHPNRPGFEIYLDDVGSLDGYWDAFDIRNDYVGSAVHAHCLHVALWVLSYGASGFFGIQIVYNEINRLVLEKMGHGYPIKRKGAKKHRGIFGLATSIAYLAICDV